MDAVNKKVKADVSQKRVAELDTLFDIVNCRHDISLCGEAEAGCTGCDAKAHVSCDCPRPQKVPKLELEWLCNQRRKTSEQSNFQMSSRDAKEESRQENVRKRKSRNTVKASEGHTFRHATEKSSIRTGMQHRSSQSTQAQAEEEPEEWPEEEPDEEQEQLEDDQVNGDRSSVRSYMPVSNAATASLRYGTSSTAAAAIASGFLSDLIAAGHLPPEKIYLACDTKKMWRAKQRAMSSVRVSNENEDPIQAVFFDGKRDKTKVIEVNEETGRPHQRAVKEDHITITQEPQGKYRVSGKKVYPRNLE